MYMLLKSDRLVVSTTLQKRIVDIAHEGRLGIVRTQRSSAGGVVPMHGQDGRNEDQGLHAVSRGYPSLHKRTASDVSIT